MLKPKFQKHIYPDSVILIRGDDDAIRKHAKGLSKEANLKWDVENLQRRLQKWDHCNSLELFKTANNDPNLGLPIAKKYMMPLTRFYQEYKTEVFEVDFASNEFEMFEAMRVYIERNGRSYNYLISVKSLNVKREEHLTLEEQTNAQEQTQQKQQLNAAEQKKHDALVALAEGRLEFLASHQKSLEWVQKMYMRQYLMKCIIPVLTEGMIDVWSVGPTDPVDYLADYIFKKSNECQR